MKGKAVGKIVEWVEENNEHYPVFSFTTNNNVQIKSRCIDKIGEEMIETSLESQYDFETVDKILSAPLPHENIYISYDIDNPNHFLARWIAAPEWFLTPQSEKKEVKETKFQFVKRYLFFIVINIIFPFFGMIPTFIYAKNYLDRYKYENDKGALSKSILYWVLLGFGLIYIICIGYHYWAPLFGIIWF